MTSKRTQPPWNGTDFYVSLGEGERRNWEDAREYGFISAGGGSWCWASLRALEPGNRIFAYLLATGYVGVGWVKDTVKPEREFTVTLSDGRTVPGLEAQLRAPNAGKDADDRDQAEYFVRVEWEETVPREQAFLEPGLFANQNSACKLRDRATLEQLYERFGQNKAADEDLVADH